MLHKLIYVTGEKGFEPLRVGSKFQCLTAWLHPINFVYAALSELKVMIALAKLFSKEKNACA